VSKNKPASAVWIAEIAIPGGWNQLILSEAEARNYDTDPDLYAARHFGLTKIEYLQWIDLDGAPLCSHRTRGGDLCKNNTGGYQLEAKEWKARHRKIRCAAHSKM
jgi:hypothetical protein